MQRKRGWFYACLSFLIQYFQKSRPDHFGFSPFGFDKDPVMRECAGHFFVMPADSFF
jgi:hypothetical protein